MEKKLFLIGPTGCGKSRLIRETLGENLASAGGFVTLRQTDEEGRFVGFSLLPAAAAGGVEGFDAQLYLDCRAFPPIRDHEVFRESGVQLLEEAAWYPFALLDEVGGYELVIPQFAIALDTLLASGLPCLGALRNSEDAELLRSLLGLSDRYPAKRNALEERLRRDKDCRVIELRDDNADEVKAMLQAWTKEYS